MTAMIIQKIINRLWEGLDRVPTLQSIVEDIKNEFDLISCALTNFAPNPQADSVQYIGTPMPNYLTQAIFEVVNFPELQTQLQKGDCVQCCPWICDRTYEKVTLLICPIQRQENILGYLWLICCPERIFHQENTSLIQQVSRLCSMAFCLAYSENITQAQKRELERLDLLQENFLNNLAHELRTPMAKIRLVTQALEVHLEQLGILSNELSPVNLYLEILDSESLRELRLIDDLLELLRLETTVEPLSVTNIKLQHWLPYMVEPFLNRINQNQQRIRFVIPAHLPPLKTDWFYLSRILNELLENACKYTPTHEKIIVSARATPDSVQIAVSNSGVEIPKLDLVHIFDKFYQVPNCDRRKQQGTGLGLALVKKQVELLGGTIEAYSEQGWTIFILKLPWSLKKVCALPLMNACEENFHNY